MPTSLAPTAGANGLTLTTTRSISPIPCASSSVELGRDVAPREDAGVDRGVEGLDLAADASAGRRSGRMTDATSMPSAGEVLAGAVGREHLDAEVTQLAGEGRDPLAVRD